MSEPRPFIRAAAAIFLIAIPFTATSCTKKEPVAAVVNEVEITFAAVERQLDATRQQYQAQGSDIPAGDLTEARTQILNGMIETVLLVQEAEKLEIEGSEVEAAAQVESIRSQFDSDEGFSEALKANGYTPGSLMKEILDSITIDKLLKTVAFSELVVTDEEAKEFYGENPDLFAVPATIEASHILVSVELDAAEDDVTKAQNKIKEIQQSLADGTDFAELARLMSEGPSAANGGSLGSFSRGQMVPEFEEVAFSLEPGEVSDPVRTSFGFHIIKMTGQAPASSVPFEEVTAQILEYLEGTKKDETTAAYIENLRKEAAIELFDFPEPETEEAAE